MQVFISWSGQRSKRVAEALRDWLPSVIQSVEPFMSASDIEIGSRWSNDVGMHLEKAQFGLICLTQDNLEAPWLLFEAGALSKSVADSRVVPYLYGVTITHLQGPLSQFQAVVADKNSTLDVTKSINEALGENGLEQERLERAFETWWPQLEKALGNIPTATEEAPPPRSDRDILEEVLSLCRQMSRPSGSRLESERENLINLFAHGLLTEPIDSAEGFRPEDLQSSADAARRQAMQHRRRENAYRRHLRELLRDVHFSSEGEEQPGNDADKEA